MQKRLQSDSALSQTVATGFGWHHLTLSFHQIPMARLFLGSARTVPPEVKWRPRAQLSLSTP